jgi:hypothetical protein
VDPVSWSVVGLLISGVVAAVALAPTLHRRHRRRQELGQGGSLAGVGAGLDSVWRPSAAEANADWEVQLEVPAPSPAPGDRGRIRGDRIVLDGVPQHERRGADQRDAGGAPPSLPRGIGSS